MWGVAVTFETYLVTLCLLILSTSTPLRSQGSKRHGYLLCLDVYSCRYGVVMRDSSKRLTRNDDGGGDSAGSPMEVDP